MATNPWGYDQWFQKYGNNMLYTNPESYANQSKFYGQDQQLGDTGWNQQQLYDAVRYAQNQQARQADPTFNFGAPLPKPDYAAGSGYVSPYASGIGNTLRGDAPIASDVPLIPPSRVGQTAADLMPGYNPMAGLGNFNPNVGPYQKKFGALPTPTPQQNPVNQVAPAPNPNPTRTAPVRVTQPFNPDMQKGMQNLGIDNNGLYSTETPQIPTDGSAPLANPYAGRVSGTTAGRGVGGSTRSSTTGSMPGVVAGVQTGQPGIALNQGQSTNYNPQGFQYNQNSNPFINSSGGFAYDALPGMWNYMNQFLGYNANNAAGRADALTDFAGNNITQGYPQGMSDYIQQMVNMLGYPQAAYGTGMQQQGANSAMNLANGQVPQTGLQQQTTDYLSQLLGGSGLTSDYVRAMEESVLKPQQDMIYGQANRGGQGQVAPSSGLTQELQRRNSSDFYNQLVKSGFENRNQNINQAMQQGGQTFNQGLNLSQLLGNMGQQGIQNSYEAMSQGQNLQNQFLGALLGLQGNQQNYASNLSGQYGDLAKYLLGSKNNMDIAGMQNSQQNAQNTGSWIAKLLPLLAGLIPKNTTNPNTPGQGNPPTVPGQTGGQPPVWEPWNPFPYPHPGSNPPSPNEEITQNTTFPGIGDWYQQYMDYVNQIGSGQTDPWYQQYQQWQNQNYNYDPNAGGFWDPTFGSYNDPNTGLPYDDEMLWYLMNGGQP